MTDSTIGKLSRGLTINWHCTPKCNMACKYCFAPRPENVGEIDYRLVLKKLALLFTRVNFVGGEPSLLENLPDMAAEAKKLGMATSMVSNGCRLVHDRAYTERILPVMDAVGISIDSVDKATNLQLGRSVGGVPLEAKDYLELGQLLAGNSIPLKINTVVSSLNLNDDLTRIYGQLQVRTIKILQCYMPDYAQNRRYTNLLVRDEDFSCFVQRHEKFKGIIQGEPASSIKGSYLMLDSTGCFYSDTGTVRSKSLGLESTDVYAEFAKCNYDLTKYHARYEKPKALEEKE